MVTERRDRTSLQLRDLAARGRAHPDVVLLVSVVGCLLVGLADHLTGQLVSPNLFYVVPVAATSAAAGRRAGLLVVGVATVVGFVASAIGPDHPSLVIIAWNLGARATFLTAGVVLVDALSHTLEQLERLATTDPLTGALNRRALYERAAVEIARHRRDGAPISLAYFDLDGLKLLNDRDGHDAGDALIVTFVTTVAGHVRPGDLVARLGGDEFALLVPGQGPDDAASTVQRLLAELERRGCRASAGIVTVDLSTDELEPSLQRADAAMYRAKAGQLGVVVDA